MKLDSSKGHLWTAQHVAGRELLSVDPTRRAIELDFINRLLARLNVAPARPPAERLRAIVDALDSGELDGAVQPLGSALESGAPVADPQRFDEVSEFNYDTWFRRR